MMTNSERQAALVAAVVAALVFYSLLTLGGGIDVAPGFFWEVQK
jgi:hypothetical protein